MAVWVARFLRKGSKLRCICGQRSTTSNESISFCEQTFKNGQIWLIWGQKSVGLKAACGRKIPPSNEWLDLRLRLSLRKRYKSILSIRCKFSFTMTSQERGRKSGRSDNSKPTVVIFAACFGCCSSSSATLQNRVTQPLAQNMNPHKSV